MKKNLLIIFFLFLCFGLAPKFVAAASFKLVVSETPDLIQTASSSPIFNNPEIDIDKNVLQGWANTAGKAAKNMLKYTPDNPLNLIAQAINESPKNSSQATFYHYDYSAIYDYTSKLAEQISQKPQDASMTIEDSRVTNFVPAMPGIQMDAYQTSWKILQALEQHKASTTADIYLTSPQKTLADTNSLGINELLATGVSSFKGSPSNRQHNIAIGVEKMKGVIMAPGETFSFNKFLGPVDGEHGFLPELVIKKEGTVPEFGGGLCQVSSTTFRAAMNAGLPIIERRNHAYAVSYYSPQGTDATIYPGVVDLRFTNDTPGHLLIWPYFKDKYTLIFDFYGTKDNRQITVEKPVQYDKKTDGSMKAIWTRVVLKDGQAATSTFRSTYLPPALFHKEEKFVPTSTPATVTAPASTNSTTATKPQQQ